MPPGSVQARSVCTGDGQPPVIKSYPQWDGSGRWKLWGADEAMRWSPQDGVSVLTRVMRALAPHCAFHHVKTRGIVSCLQLKRGPQPEPTLPAP